MGYYQPIRLSHEEASDIARVTRATISALCVLCGVLVSSLIPDACLGQSVGFGIGWYGGASDAELRPDSESDVRLVYSPEIHFRGFLSTDHKNRFGLRWNRQHVRSESGDGDDINFAMDSILLSFQRRVWGRDRAVLALSLCAGPSLMGNDTDAFCDALFCTNTHVRWSLVPGSIVMLNLYRGLALQIGCHYNVLLTGHDSDTRPFKSGFLLSAGLAFEFDGGGSGLR